MREGAALHRKDDVLTAPWSSNLSRPSPEAEKPLSWLALLGVAVTEAERPKSTLTVKGDGTDRRARQQRVREQQEAALDSNTPMKWCDFTAATDNVRDDRETQAGIGPTMRCSPQVSPRVVSSARRLDVRLGLASLSTLQPVDVSTDLFELRLHEDVQAATKAVSIPPTRSANLQLYALPSPSGSAPQARVAELHTVVSKYEGAYDKMYGELPSRRTYCPDVYKLRQEYLQLKGS